MNERAGTGWLLAGLFAGGLVGLLQFPKVSGEAVSLPVAIQMRHVALAWLGYAAVGAALALVARVTPGLRRIWPPAVALAALAWLELVPLLAGLGPTSAALVAGVGSLTLVALATGLVRIAPWLGSPALWASLNALALALIWTQVRRSPPFDHGVGWSSTLLSWATLLIPAIVLLRAGHAAGGARRVVALVLVLVLLVLPLPPWPRELAPTPSDAKNVLLITIDTLRADHLGCYGNERVRTPAMDALAADGILFEHAISPIPITNPSHTSILTGLYPAHHGVIQNKPLALRPGVATLPELLEPLGYRTAAFVSGSTLKKSLSTLSESFQLYDDELSPVRLLPETLLRTSLAQLVYPDEEDRTTGFSQRTAGQAVDAASAWLASNADTSPFFLWVHLFDPHGPYTPPARFVRMYDAGEFEPVGLWPDLGPEERKRIVEDPRKLAHLVARYAGEVTYTDEQIGRLLSRVDELGLAETTAIVLTADHGESLTENDHYFGHQHCLYDTTLRVPLLLRLPGGPAGGRRFSQLVELIDVAPTLLEYLGQPVPQGLDGRSLLSPAAPPEATERVAWSAVFWNGRAGSKSMLAARAADHKYIRSSRWWGGILLAPVSEELYDLQADPGETVNRIALDPARTERYRALVEPYWESWFRDGAEPDADLPEDLRERLRSLGYVQ